MPAEPTSARRERARQCARPSSGSPVLRSRAALRYIKKMVQLSDRARGVAIAAAGVLCVTPDALRLRWAQKQGANTASILFWKFFFVFWFTCAWVFYVEKKAAPAEGVIKSLYERIKTGPKHFWAAVGLQISLDVLFSLAFLIIAAARVMIWYSLNVLWSAILGCALLGDVLPRRTIVTCIFALGCIAMVFGPELATKKGREGSPWGDLAAIYVGVAVAVYLIIVRHAARERPRVPITFATTVGALAAFVLVSLSTLVTGDCIVPKVSSPGLFYLCMALDGFAIAGIFVAFSIAPRYITGAEVSLCSLLETVLGPLWVFLIYNEKPGPFTLAGGLLLIGALFVHELLAAREAVQRRERERQGADASLRAMEGIIGDAKSPDSTLGASSAPSDGTGDGALSDLPSEKTVSVAADTSDSVFSVAANSV